MSDEPRPVVSLDAKLIAASNLAVASALWNLALKKSGDTPISFSVPESRSALESGMEIVEEILEKMRAGK